MATHAVPSFTDAVTVATESTFVGQPATGKLESTFPAVAVMVTPPPPFTASVTSRSPKTHGTVYGGAPRSLPESSGHLGVHVWLAARPKDC